MTLLRILLALSSITGISLDIYGIIYAFDHLVSSVGIGAIIGYLTMLIVLIILAIPIMFFGIFGLITAMVMED